MWKGELLGWLVGLSFRMGFSAIMGYVAISHVVAGHISTGFCTRTLSSLGRVFYGSQA